MTEAEAIGAILWLSLTAYAVLAGADFGGGVWDLFATGPRQAAQRQAIAAAMGPVWEANHVWLIFMIVGLFTCFPPAFAALAVGLFAPFTIALMGIVLRGAAFAFRAHAREAIGPIEPWGGVFGAASVISPFFLGVAAGATASGSIHAAGSDVRFVADSPWTVAFIADVGLFAVALCAYLAATYLMVETDVNADLQADFRNRAAAAAIASGVLGLAGLILAYVGARPAFDSLTGRGLPLLVLALVNGPLALLAVWRSEPRLARVAVAAQVTFVLWALAVGQWPYLVRPTYTLDSAAAPAGTLTGFLIVAGAGMLLLLPSLYLLFRVFKGRNPASVEADRTKPA
ncbi:MAG TPA: cytochrome d ubiquinol oxidase subunit II [Candidatus Dormibacteraeota bacterium]|nr:cytochrome d ubiquinol oxidase subunit II [Candidatus Dormibacteraeota bacterium]